MIAEPPNCQNCGATLDPLDILPGRRFTSCLECGSRVPVEQPASRESSQPGGTRYRDLYSESLAADIVWSASAKPELGARKNEHAIVKRRMEGIFWVFVLMLLILVVRLADLQILKADSFRQLANKMQMRTMAIPASRGRIMDRNGNELAQDVVAKGIALNPRVVDDPPKTSALLAKLLRLDAPTATALQEKLVKATREERKERSAYISLKRGVPRKLAEEILARAKKDPALKGLWLEDVPTRVYPAGADAIQLVGAVGSDGRGVEALELKLDSVLRGEDGERRARVGATGIPIPDSAVRLREPINGQDVRLTIERDVQHFVETELAKMAEKQRPDAATAVVLDVQTSEVLGMANWPSYTPGDKVIDPEKRRNRAITDTFEPGSIFKVLTGVAAMDHGVNTRAYCGGRIQVGKYGIGCAHGARHGSVDMNRMVEESCNIAAGLYAERVGPERLWSFLDNLGFQRKTEIEFPGEASRRFLPAEDWKRVRTINIGFGQGIAITPIQLAAAYAAIANDGVYTAPRLVQEAPGYKLPGRVSRPVMKPETARLMRKYMENCVNEGTGTKAKIPGYSVGGKTGTAQLVANGRYQAGAYVASFAGFVPAHKPRLAILVSVWHPRAEQYGGSVSAPVFREIARQSAAFLKIPPDQPNDVRDGANPATFSAHKRGRRAAD